MSVTFKECQTALKKSKGNKSAAARALGVTRNTFLWRLSQGPEAPATYEQKREQKSKISSLEAELRDKIEEHEKDKKALDYLKKITAQELKPPKWLQAKNSKPKLERGIVTAFLSDLHLDERVYTSQLNGLNCYNRQIAILRLREFFDNLVELSQEYINGIKIEGLVLPFGGDFLSGNIHEELRETNEAPILSSMFFWAEQLCAGIQRLLDAGFEDIYIPAVPGNHGRLDKKPRAKFAVEDNFDWGMYVTVANHFKAKGIKEVHFDISPALDKRFQIYGTRYLLTHGDQFKGGSGIAGALSPLMIGDSRKRKRENSVSNFAEILHHYTNTKFDSRSFDFMMVGHWHQLAMFKSIIMNGSLKGYDEYAMKSNFDFEVPQQFFWITDPNHGITIRAPIHVLSKKEVWDV